METSAKENINVDSAFLLIAKNIKDFMFEDQPPLNHQGIILGNPVVKSEPTKDTSCCK
jgi:hypothetical protein